MGWADDHNRIELAADVAAAAIFASAVGFAVSVLAAEAGLATLLLVAVAFRLAYAGLRRISAGRSQALPVFEVPTIEQAAAKELLLHEASAAPNLRLVGSTRKADGRERGRSSGNPIHFTRPRTAPSDDSQALSDALAQLRRSLR